MSEISNIVPYTSGGMPPNFIDYIDRTRGPESTTWGKDEPFRAHALRRDNIVDSTRGQRHHSGPHAEISRVGTSDHARRSFVEALHAEVRRDSTTQNMDGVGHVNREGTATGTIGHSHITEPYSHTQIASRTNPGISLSRAG